MSTVKTDRPGIAAPVGCDGKSAESTGMGMNHGTNEEDTHLRIKICGLTRPEDIAAVNEVLPDYAGFVFVPGSRRYVSREAAAALRAQLDPRIVSVGVFVDAPAEAVAELTAAGIIGIAQLHGHEDAAYIRRLRELMERSVMPVERAASRTDEQAVSPTEETAGCRIIQAFRIDGPEDADRAMNSEADLVLLDHGAGGTGECFDWSWLQDMQRPYLLAGGLDPDNVAEAVAAAGSSLYGVDVSSGVETDRKKDPGKIRRFAQAVRSCREDT